MTQLELQKIKRQPIKFDAETHRYIWEPTGEIFVHSVTGITGFDMDEKKKKAIEKTKHIWAPRGSAVHAVFEYCLNLKIKARDPDFIEEALDENSELSKNWEKYSKWTLPLTTHRYFYEDFEPIETEFTVCDRKNSIAGTFDAFGFDKRTKKYVLLDLKTQQSEKANPYNTNEQLGAYLSMLMSLGVQVDECRTVWCRPNKTVIGEFQHPTDCLSDWNYKLDIWKMYQEEF
tara:strand:+ start:509 stop:1201 length:693 start_codon:yes stop_codon:yes gene_type:complete